MQAGFISAREVPGEASLRAAFVSGAVILAVLGGCQVFGPAEESKSPVFANAFAYQPINPLTVWVTSSDKSLNGIAPIGYSGAFLTDFSNDATRVAMAKMNAKGTLTYGPVSATVSGETYSMVFDYIKYMTISVPVRVFEARTPAIPPTVGKKEVPWSFVNNPQVRIDPDTGIPAKLRYIAIEATASAEEDLESIKYQDPDAKRPTADGDARPKSRQKVIPRREKDEKIREMFAGSMPLYIGVGLRVRADFKSSGGDVKGGLPGLSAEASAGRINGTLSVQTMGISGSEITPLLPIPSDLSAASIQAAIQAAASIKVKLHDPTTVVHPMIVGFESPVTEGDVAAELTSFVYGRTLLVSLEQSDLKTVDGTKTLLWLKWNDPSDLGASQQAPAEVGPPKPQS